MARRLRDTEVPPFQDTYGWILSRRGDYAEALTYLEPAAAALAGNPLVQFHHAEAALALERSDAARAELPAGARRLRSPGGPLPQAQAGARPAGRDRRGRGSAGGAGRRLIAVNQGCTAP